MGGHRGTPAEMGLRISRHPMARRTGELDMHSREWGSEVWYSPQTQAAKWTMVQSGSIQGQMRGIQQLPVACMP